MTVSVSSGLTERRSTTSISAAFGGQFLGHGQGLVHHRAVGHQGQVASGAGDARFAHRHRLGRQLLGLEMVIEVLVLAKDDRVINRHRLQQHAVGILDRGGRQHNQARIMRVEASRLWLWKGPLPDVPPHGKRTVMGQGTWVRQYSVAAWLTIWLKATVEKSANCNLDDRAHSLDGRAYGQAQHGIFADGRVEHPPWKPLREVLVALKAPPKAPTSCP